MSHILIIDDAPSSLMVIEEYLVRAGHTVVASQSSRYALKLATSQQFDLVITDIYMPDKDGLEIISDMRRICPGVPIIAMTGAEGIRDMRPIAMSMGAAVSLHKPFTPAELTEAVTAALAQRSNGNPGKPEAVRSV